MNNYDDILVKLFWNKETNQGSKYYRKFNQKQNSYSNIFNYLNNRFDDSESIYESLLRLVFNIFERPVCPICGNKVRFIGKPNNKGIFTKTCCQRCSTKLTNNYNKHIKESQEKAKKTKLEKYGDEHYNNSEQIKKTKLEKYGISGYNNLEKIKQTKLELYGDKNYNNRIKYKETTIKRYGVEHITKLKETIEKINNTKIKNKSFNKSNQEDECYKLLKEKYSDIIRQYRSKQYPFNCDFYIPSINLYIEYNGLWTHGFHPFNENNIDDQKKLDIWKSKNSNYYKSAIKVWTIGDIKKRNTAKQNNLNFIEFWNLNEVKEWIINQH